MIDLKQKELKEWQERSFPREELLELDKEVLVNMILNLQMVLGMAEEVGEVAHRVLKATQRIRSGVNGMDSTFKREVGDGVADTLVFGMQLLSLQGLDAEEEISKTTKLVLGRDWQKNPTGS